MKNVILFLVSGICSIVISLPTYAVQTITLNHDARFDPVKWRVTQVTGGFSIKNGTTKHQYIQIVLNNGSVEVFKKTMNNGIDCVASLGGNAVTRSTICELSPSETLYIDKDFSYPEDAVGTYQIEMGVS